MAGFCLEKCPDALFVLMCIIYYMRKFKKYFTIFLLYEFVILTVLHINRYCMYVFNNNFCYNGNFKYLFMCVVVPALVGLFIWWIPEISRLFCKKCQCEPRTEKTLVSKQIIERLIIAGLFIGIQKFVEKYPKTKELFNDVLEVVEKEGLDKKAR